MSDLIDKYFRQDLTGPEKKALEEELASSEESAQRFGELAEKAYRRFGLPEPKWTGPDRLPHHGAPDYKTWTMVAALLAVIGGLCALVYEEWKGSAQNPAASLRGEPTPVLHPTPIFHPRKPGAKESGPDQSQVLARAKAAVPPPPPAQPAVPPPPATVLPSLTPVNLDLNPNQPFSSISAQLRLTSVRSVVVRVLDPQGKELLVLFDGNLGMGTWSFEWNGRTGDGNLAPPGLYKIEVRAGTWVQTKEVAIEK
jgi:hypothetical protein